MLIKYGKILWLNKEQVQAHYEQHGYTTSGDAYNKDMRKAKKANATSYYSAPAQRNAEVDAWFDDCHAKCLGYCDREVYTLEIK